MSDPSPLFGLSQRIPPANLQAEQALLGAMLANNRAYERVADYLVPSHFADPVHARIYEAIAERILSGHTADAVTLRQDFEHSGVLDEVGGVPYLAQLLGAMVGIINASEYGHVVHDAWLRRQLIDLGGNMINAAFGADPRQDARAQIDQAERTLNALANGGQEGDRIVSIGDAVSSAVAMFESLYRGDASPAVQTGMATVDAALGGLWPKNLILLAGIPGAGKTALAVQMAVRIAQRLYRQAVALGASAEEAFRQPGVSFFSLEMSADELGMRVAAEIAGVSVERLMRGDMDLAIAAELVRAQREVQFLPLRIHECRQTSLKLLGAKVRMHLGRQAELVVMVDHLLVVDGDENARGRQSSGNDAATVAKAARDMKTLAKETGLPFLVLSHASRASAARTNPRPTMGDVKWAGEGDADVLLFVHRPAMFMDGEPPARGTRESDEKYDERRNRWYRDRDAVQNLAELVVAKRRMGPPGVWKLHWNGATTSFGEWIPAP